MKAVIYLLTLLWIFGGITPQALANKNYGQYYSSIKGTQADQWPSHSLKRPLEKKIEPLGVLARDYNIAWNKWDGFKLVPDPVNIAAKTKKMIVSEIKKLPHSLQKFIQKHVVAIYTAKNIGGTAMAGVVYDKQAVAKFGFVILDMNMLDKDINSWATNKENSVFNKVKGYKLNMQLAKPQENTKVATFRYVMLHEIGHIFHSVMQLQPAHPHLNWRDKDFAPFAYNHPELLRKKKLGEDYYPLDERIGFYRPEPPFDLDDTEEIYEWLTSTTHPSLYGSVNQLEDFAEAFSLLIHVKYLGHPAKLEVKQGKKIIVKMHERILSPALKDKVQIIEDSLKKFE